jgi:hypothetical protein
VQDGEESLSSIQNNLKHKHTTLLLCAFLLMTLSSTLFAQVTRETLQYVGTSQLQPIAPSAISSDDLQISPHPDSDTELAGVNRGPGSASIPLITAPQAISSAGARMELGFNGLSHRDQRLAGSGQYANSQFSTEPPDQGLAAGNGFVMQAVNAALAIYDAKTGILRQGPTALNQFFRLKPEINRANATYGDFTSDPRVFYDTQLQRWFVTVVAIATRPQTGIFTAPTHLLIAVSESADPTQGWRLYRIETTNDGIEGCPCFGDQPLVATDSHGLFITTNAFSLREGFAGVQVYALSKQLLAEGAMPAIVHWNGLKTAAGFPFTVQPAVHLSFETDDAAHGVEYMISVADIRNMLDHRVAVWAFSNTASLVDSAPALKISSVIVDTQPFGVPPDAQQKPGDTELGSLVSEKEQFISTNDQRMQQATFANGNLWCALTTIVAIGSDPVPHAGIAYFALTPTTTAGGAVSAQVSHQGYLAAANADLFFPSLTVAPNDHAVIVFTLSGAGLYPSAAFAELTNRGAGEIQVVATGAAPYDGFSGYKYFGGSAAARMGDYSDATVDENGAIWIASEYIPLSPRTLLSNWGSFVARIASK